MSVHNLSFCLSVPPLHLPGVHLAEEIELFFPLFDFLITGKLSFFLSASHTYTHMRAHIYFDPNFAEPPNCVCAGLLWEDKDTTQRYIRENHFPLSATMALGSCVILPRSAFLLSVHKCIFNCIILWSVCMYRLEFCTVHICFCPEDHTCA